MEITFLGTSCMKPTKERNHAGVLLVRKGEGFLFDCGEGIQRQLVIAGIKPTIIKKIFITHWHGDHVLGIPGLLQTMSASGYEGTVELYGPVGTKKFMNYLTKAFASKTTIDIKIHEVKNGKINEEKEFKIFSHELKHSTPCVGYAFEEKDWRKVNMKKANALGLHEGPLLGKLQRGEKIKHEEKTVSPDQVTQIVKGRKVTYVTDTLPCSGAVKLAKDADILILEATYKSDREDKAKEYYHLTAKDAALIANQANAKRLILTHFSTRYKTAQETEEDARDVFDNTQAAEDFMRVKL
jgi:ribonuclease Z